MGLCTPPFRCSLRQSSLSSTFSLLLEEPGAPFFLLVALSCCKKQVCTNVTW